MKRINCKELLKNLDNKTTDKIFLNNFRAELSSFVYQRPIERPSFFLLFNKTVTVFGIFVFILASGGGLALASQSSFPGQWLYPVKIATEKARLSTATKPEIKKKLKLEFIDRRVEEVTKITKEKNPGNSAKKALIIIDQEIKEIEKEDNNKIITEPFKQTASSSVSDNYTLSATSSISDDTRKKENYKRDEAKLVRPKEMSREDNDLQESMNKLRKSHLILENLLNNKIHTDNKEEEIKSRKLEQENKQKRKDLKKEPEKILNQQTTTPADNSEIKKIKNDNFQEETDKKQRRDNRSEDRRK